MNSLPRIAAVFTLLIAPLALLAAGHNAAKPAAKTYRVFVGTYTHETQSKGIYQFTFDSATGKMSAPELAAEAKDPSWVVVHPNGKYLYAANETGKTSAISAYSIEVKTGKLTLLNQLPALGEDPCHLSFDRTGKFLFVANYSSGNVVVFPILADGRLGENTANAKDQGTLGPNKERQEGPHAHWIEASPDNRFVFVSDLGLDAILIHRFDRAKGTLTPNDPPSAKLAPGAGPRHAIFSPDGKFLFVVSELNSTVTTFSYDSAKGSLAAPQAVSTLPADFHGRNDTAEIAVHPSGRGLMASNRGHDSIAMFRIDEGGALTSIGIIPTGGREPRHFTFDPTGFFVLAENQNSNSIVTFRVNLPRGDLTQVSQTDGIPSPVCLAFLRLD